MTKDVVAELMGATETAGARGTVRGEDDLRGPTSSTQYPLHAGDVGGTGPPTPISSATSNGQRGQIDRPMRLCPELQRGPGKRLSSHDDTAGGLDRIPLRAGRRSVAVVDRGPADEARVLALPTEPRGSQAPARLRSRQEASPARRAIKLSEAGEALGQRPSAEPLRISVTVGRCASRSLSHRALG